jgi:non-ribosomal peptide synthetase component E (peptide arylation enzyme)
LESAARSSREAVCALFHTGGTTRRPKLVRLTHGNQIHAAWSFAQLYGLNENDVVINGFPLFSCWGDHDDGSLGACGQRPCHLSLTPQPERPRGDPNLEKVKMEVDRIFGGTVTPVVAVAKDQKLNTVVRVEVPTDDAVGIQKLKDALEMLPQPYTVVARSG